MSLISLPNQSVTGANLWSQVEDNDQAIVDVVNGAIDDGNIATGADIDGAKLLAASVDTTQIADGAVTNAKLDLSVTTATNNADVISTADTEETAIVTGSLGAGTYIVLVSGQVRVPETVSTCYVRLKAGSTTLQTFNPYPGGGSNANLPKLPLAMIATTTTASSGTFSLTIQAPTTGFGSAIEDASTLTVIRIA